MFVEPVAIEELAAPTGRKKALRREVSVPVKDKLIWDTQDIVAITGLSATTIARLRDRGVLPKPVDLGIDRVCWHAHEIRDWLKSQKG